ncbi:tRNA lysidine(34) synthetase TilS [soil metagenome]
MSKRDNAPLPNRLQAHLQADNLLRPGEKVLLAVSGGLDSVVMAHLLHGLGFAIAVAHCNFQLRGDDADGDEAFVKQLAEQLHLPFYSTRFDTKRYAKQHGLSTQMAARDLRYEWLENIRKESECYYLATAHHLNDQAETVLLNMVKGTGIRGLHGMLPKHGHLVRPLLPFTREELEQYATKQNLTWRTDASNADTHYQRNYLRHKLLPMLAEINPAVVETLAKNAAHFTDAATIYEQGIKHYLKKLIEKRAEGQFVPIKKLKLYPAQSTLLYEWLSPQGFNEAQVHEILTALDETEVKQFYSPSHRLIKDRQFLVLTDKATENDHRVIIEKYSKRVKVPGLELKFHVQTATNYHIPAQPTVAALDADKLTLPLTLRRWQRGDYLYPIGPKRKKKKVSNLLGNLKLTQLQKENTWVLCSGEHIVWVVGLRVDDRFKVTAGTRGVVEIGVV